MTDIVERLHAVERDMGADSWPHGAAVVREAAAEIERLRAALREVADMFDRRYPYEDIATTVRAALAEDGKP